MTANRMMTRTDIEDLLNAWEKMERASTRVETSLPFKLSQAVNDLEAARLQFRAVLNKFSLVSLATVDWTVAQWGQEEVEKK